MTEAAMNAVIDRMIESFNQHDMESFLATFHPQFKWTRLPDGKTREGRDGLREVFQPQFTAKKIRCAVRSRFAVSGAIVTREEVTGSSNAPEGFIAAYIYTFKDGLIDQFWSIY